STSGKRDCSITQQQFRKAMETLAEGANRIGARRMWRFATVTGHIPEAIRLRVGG
ncbi:hypothetical protein FRC00_000815, partial [Tulasnella sp. 408]